MLQTVLVASAIDVRQSGDYWNVNLIETYCYSTIGGGRLDRQFTSYESLTIEETRDVLEMLASGPLPGDALTLRSEQLTLL